jgi:hypothetical protein
VYSTPICRTILKRPAVIPFVSFNSWTTPLTFIRGSVLDNTNVENHILSFLLSNMLLSIPFITMSANLFVDAIPWCQLNSCFKLLPLKFFSITYIARLVASVCSNLQQLHSCRPSYRRPLTSTIFLHRCWIVCIMTLQHPQKQS